MNDGVKKQKKLCNWKNNNYAHKEHKFTNIHANETFITYTHTYTQTLNFFVLTISFKTAKIIFKIMILCSTNKFH